MPTKAMTVSASLASAVSTSGLGSGPAISEPKGLAARMIDKLCITPTSLVFGLRRSESSTR
ncbi:MAG: hypothetical protein BWZ10_01336 [candidate division BRC1 bacterium ADurb.BinA364]|nr:MAG: hypothetical protein BWZ10_01336 [candidate division BRC1 bacterium ADurb.BinA364]